MRCLTAVCFGPQSELEKAIVCSEWFVTMPLRQSGLLDYWEENLIFKCVLLSETTVKYILYSYVLYYHAISGAFKIESFYYYFKRYIITTFFWRVYMKCFMTKALTNGANIKGREQYFRIRIFNIPPNFTPSLDATCARLCIIMLPQVSPNTAPEMPSLKQGKEIGLIT